MEIKEITSGEVQAYEKDGSDKILRKSDRILDNAKEKLSPSEISKVDEILEGLQRDINCLHDGTRFAKRKAMERIQAQISAKIGQGVVSGVFAGLCKPLLSLFYDPIEKCREVSVVMVTEITAQMTDIQTYLPYIIPMCVMRLGQKEIVEPSEEIRQLLLELLIQIISLSPAEMPLYCQDIIIVLARTVSDPFAEVKKLSCTCLINITAVAPKQFHTGANFLLSPLLQSISHQHQKVRTLVIRALGALLNNGDNKMIEDIMSHLAQRTFDPCPPVREAVYEVVGEWLVTLLDRYSYFHKLLPIVMTGIQDEVPEISAKSDALFAAAGKQWEEENEQDIKDEKDFAAEHEEYYGVLAGTNRPRLGCRILVTRNLSKILPGLLNDLNTWVDETRVKSVQLLYSLLLSSESNSTQHLEKILFALYRTSMEPGLQSEVDKCTQALAQFIQPEVWKPFVLTALCGSSSGEVKSRVGVSPQLCTSCLRVLSSLITGSKRESLLTITSELLDTICKPEVNESSHEPLFRELALVVQAILNVLGESVSGYTCQLLFLLLRLATVNKDGGVGDVEGMISRLATLQGISVDELYTLHTPSLVEQLSGQHKDWTRHSPDQSLFGELLLRAGQSCGSVMQGIYDIFRDCTSKDKDPELRMSMFTLLGRMLREAPVSEDASKHFSLYSVGIIKEIIIPNLEWRAGRTAGTVRCAAVSSLWALLRSNLLSTSQLKQIQAELTAQLISNLDDDNCATRLVTCNCFNFILKVGGRECFEPEQLHNLYCELLKRLDDSSDELRLAVTETFATFFELLPDDYDKDLYKAHLQVLYRGLLIHLDDPNQAIQEAVYKVLEIGGRLYPQYLCEHVENVKHKHRSSIYCDKLIAAFASNS